MGTGESFRAIQPAAGEHKTIARRSLLEYRNKYIFDDLASSDQRY
jgi:hypothetical protein